MARTLTQLRQLTSNQLGLGPAGLIGSTLTADTGGTTTTVRDSVLKVFPDDRLIGYHLLLTSGSPSSTELLITDFAQANGDTTFIPALGAAPDALTYEVLPFSGTDFLRAIQDSIKELYDRGLLVRQAVTYLVSGSPIYNADWSYWTSATVVDGWTVSTSTLARERASGNIYLGETAIKLTSTAGFLGLDARYRRWLLDKIGSTVILYCPAKSDTASDARVNLRVSGTNNFSTYHGGGNGWELLSKEVSIAATATDIEVRLMHDSAAATTYYGMPFITGGDRTTFYPYPIAVLPDGPNEIRVSANTIEEDYIATDRGRMKLTHFRNRSFSDYSFIMHSDEAATTSVGLLDFSKSRYLPADGSVMQCVGDGPLTIPTANADNVEVNQVEALMIADLAAIKLLERSLPMRPAGQQREWAERVGRLQRDFNGLVGGHGQARNAAVLPMGWS